MKISPSYSLGWVYSQGASPGSSHVSNSLFLDRYRNSQTRSRAASVSSGVALPASKPTPLLLLLTWEICRQEAVFRTDGWHQHGSATTTEVPSRSKLITPLLSAISPAMGQGKTQCCWQHQETLLAECCESAKWIYINGIPIWKKYDLLIQWENYYDCSIFHSDLSVCLVWLFFLPKNRHYSTVVMQTTNVCLEITTLDFIVDNKRKNTTKNVVFFCKSVSLCMEENASCW